MISVQAYIPSMHKAYIGSKEITVRSMNPVFANDEDKKRRKSDIESGLYKIFEKYIAT